MEKRTSRSRSRPDIWADRFSGGATVGMRKDDPAEGVAATGGCILALIGVPLLAVLILNLPWLFRFLDENIKDRSLLGVIVAAFAVAVGVSLYQLRKRQRAIYAVLELVFAVVTAWTAIGKLSTQGDLSVWLAFGGAAYLTVRGLDNWEVSRAEAKKRNELKAAEQSYLPATSPTKPCS